MFTPRPRAGAAAAALALLTVACSTTPAVVAPRAYAAAPADAARRIDVATGAVTSANALASEAGLEMLRAGGNAVDAAIATAFAIGVVEPQMSGLGGSGAMVIWRQEGAAIDHLDFYAMQPVGSFRTQGAAAAPAGVAADATGTDLRIVAVPGAVAGLLEAHARHGRLPIDRVMAPAIRLAEEGFPVGQILAQFIRSDSAKLHRFDDARTRMWPDGRPLPAGATLRNPELARSLRRVAQQGRAGFYEGEIAHAVVRLMNTGGHPVTAADMAAYTPLWKQPLCATYRDHVVLSAPPPQTGAQVIHSLKLLEPHDLASAGLPTRSPRAFDIIVSALRVAMADNRGNDDPRWAAVPARGRITDEFARSRARLVGAGSAPAAVESADASTFDAAAQPAACRALTTRAVPAPAGDQTPADPAATASSAAAVQIASPGGQHTHEAAGETTHISVVDADGNAVALTQTNSTTFGSGAWVEGFFLNDSGYRFNDASLDPRTGSAQWRTRTSTIAPTIVLQNGQVRLVTGAPGAGRIPTEIVQTMVYVLDYGMDPLDALRMPRIFPAATSASVQIEHGFTPELLRQVRALGYDPVPQSSSYARLYMIVRRDGRWIAVADPRHDGEPRGY
jgi:gamma-glutamyltranspeptidase / glutathione hydrolase